jgi:hypothetical protein
MRPEEKFKGAFVRPKRWFNKKKDWDRVKKQRVFGLTTSSGKSFACLVPKPCDSIVWKDILKTQVVPFLKKSFPRRREYRVLLDGEQMLRAEPAKSFMAKRGMKLLADWPKYSPDINPQEHVWASAEIDLRKAEKQTDTFATFQQRCLKAVRGYKSAAKLVPSMAARMKEVVERHGSMTKK